MLLLPTSMSFLSLWWSTCMYPYEDSAWRPRKQAPSTKAAARDTFFRQKPEE